MSDNNKKKSDELHQAINDGNRKKVKRLLDGGVVNARDTDGLTPLMAACTSLMGALEKQRQGIVGDLLSANADVNAVDEKGRTALHYAASNEYGEIVARLLDSQSILDITDNRGRTALHYAAEGDAPVVIQTLLDRGANINRQDEEGQTPLYMAAYGGYPASVRVLIKGGANVHLADEDGNTPLHVAAGNGREVAVIDLLYGYGADIHKTNNVGEKPLHYAQWHGHDDIADILIKEMASTSGIEPAKQPEGESRGEYVFNRAAPSIVSIHTPTGFGGGVIVMPGIVATNHHVVQDSPGQIQVRWGRQTLSAKIRAIVPEEDYDFCLLEVSGLEGVEPTIQIRPSHTLNIGEDVYAIGNPKGEAYSLSAGVISQLRLRLKHQHARRWIQTDASISPGSSGGGLFDRNGNLVGITTEGLSAQDDAQNINYAISADFVFGYSFTNATMRVKDSAVEGVTADNRCVVKIDEGRGSIMVAYDQPSGRVVYKGKQISSGGFRLIAQKGEEGEATLEWVSDVSLEGDWNTKNPSANGSWKIDLDPDE